MSYFHCYGLFYHPREQRHSIGDAPAQSVRFTQGYSHQGKVGGGVHILTEAHSTLEQEERFGQVTLAEGQHADAPTGKHEAGGVIDRSSNMQPFFPEAHSFSERAQLGMARGKPGTGKHGGQDDLTEALAVPRTRERGHGLLEAVSGLMIVALVPVGEADVLVRQRVQDAIPASRGERQGTLAGGDGLVIHTTVAEMVRQKDRDLSQPTRVVKGRREGLGLAQSRQDTARVTANWKERRAQGKPEINGLCLRVALLGEMLQG